MQAKELDSTNDIITKANNDFAFKFLKAAIVPQIEHNAKESIVISPLSLSALLSYLQNGAEDKTKEEILQVLGLYGVSDTVINNSYKDIIAHLNCEAGVEIKLGSSIWASEKVNIKDEFKNIGTNFYEADIEEVNLSKKRAAKLLNDWVLNQTAGKMISGYGPKLISSENNLMLFSTVGFKGKWKIPFDKVYTKKQKYDLTYGEIDVYMMKQNLKTEYFKGDNFTAVRLPYEDDNYGMYVFVPDINTNVNELIKNIDNDRWENCMGNFVKAQVMVSIPSFGIGQGITLEDTLRSLGIKSVFENTANLSKLSENNKLYVDSIKQKAFIDVDENGTAVDSLTSVTLEEPIEVFESSIEFVADRPFMYAIVEKSSRLIIIIGKIERP
jgi:serpin B